jgi:hypothetical protein
VKGPGLSGVAAEDGAHGHHEQHDGGEDEPPGFDPLEAPVAARRVVLDERMEAEPAEAAVRP